MSHENLDDHFEQHDLESQLRGISWQPGADQKSRFLYECGKATGFAEAQAAQSRTRWLRVSVLMLAVGAGTIIGRFTAMDLFSNQQAVIAVLAEPIEPAERSRAALEKDTLFLVRDAPPKITTVTHAGMSLVMLQAKLDQPLTSHEFPATSDTNLEPRTETPIWSTGPFSDPLHFIEI